MLPEFLSKHSVEVIRSGTAMGADIDRQGIIDMHYSAIAEFGMERDVRSLRLGEPAMAKFQEGFGICWDDAVAEGRVLTAATAPEQLKVSASELLERILVAGNSKLASGLYATKLEGSDGKPVYVLNGFYARLREKFVTPDLELPWYVVQFDPSVLSWRSFRAEVIGATKPSDAAVGSLRAKFREEWKALGLGAECNHQDNGVHASAGPLESLKERYIWTGEKPEADSFGAELLARGVGTEQMTKMLGNAEVELEGGRRGRTFDLFEDIDAPEALEVLSLAKLVRG